MKNLLLTALLALTLVNSVFATGENKISSTVLNSFNIDFKQATQVSWSLRTEYAKADFTVKGQHMEAFYNSHGEMIALSKHIQLDELPVAAKRTFARKYGGYTVKEAIKLEGASEEAYYLSAENEKETVILKIDNTEDLSLFKKTKKKQTQEF